MTCTSSTAGAPPWPTPCRQVILAWSWGFSSSHSGFLSKYRLIARIDNPQNALGRLLIELWKDDFILREFSLNFPFNIYASKVRLYCVWLWFFNFISDHSDIILCNTPWSVRSPVDTCLDCFLFLVLFCYFGRDCNKHCCLCVYASWSIHVWSFSRY